jgi:hypothetical protein
MDRKEKLKCKLASCGAHMMKRTDLCSSSNANGSNTSIIYLKAAGCSNGKNIYNSRLEITGMFGSAFF